MSMYRTEILVEIDDELLADHDGEEAPPPNDVSEWYGGDLMRAIEEGIAEIVHDEIPMVRQS